MKTPARILIITYAFWPMNIIGAVRPVQTAATLLRKGYAPVVLTTIPWDKEIADAAWAKEIVEKIEIRRTLFFLPAYLVRRMRRFLLPRLHKYIAGYPGHALISKLLEVAVDAFDIISLAVNRMLDEPFWSIGIIFSGLRIILAKKVDCIFCTIPPGSSLAPAALLARMTRTPLVTDFRDLWTLNEYQDPKTAARSIKGRLRSAAEKFALDSSSYVIYNTPLAKELMDNKYPDHSSKTFAVPNGISLEAGDGNAKVQRNGRFAIYHVGSLYADRNPADFFVGLKQWMKKKGEAFKEKLSVNFVGRTADSIPKLVDQLKLNGIVKIHPQQKRDKLREMVSEADLFLLFLGYRPESSYVIPAKFYDYLAAGKPIIAFAPAGGEVVKLMQELDLADNVITSPDAQRVVELLDKEYERHAAQKDLFTVPAELKSRYDYTSIGERIERVIAMAIERE